MTDPQLIDAIRFHEAALNSLFAEAAVRGLAITMQAETPNYFGRYRIPGDEWQDQTVPAVDPMRFSVTIHRAL